jgi:WD40 repeat protein
MAHSMWHNRRVIVAGGTAGFGLVLARHLAAAGARVLVVGRSGEGVRQALAYGERRGVSLRGLTADLDRWLSGRPTVARPLSPAARAARWVWRRPAVVGVGLAMVAALLMAAWTGAQRARDSRRLVEREDEIRRQRAVAELRRGFEALRAGNVAEAAGQLEATRAIDPGLAGSLAGRWLLRRSHGERSILWGEDPLGSAEDSPSRTRDLYAIALSPDGDSAAVAAADGRVHLLSGLRGTVSSTSARGHDEVNAVAFSRDGSMLATAGQDGRLRWWHVGVQGLQPAGEATLDAGPLYASAFSPDGRSLVTGGEDRVVRLVRLDSPDQPAELFQFAAPPGKSPEIESALFVDDSRVAVSCGDVIALVDATGSGMVREFQRPFIGNRNAVLGGLAVSPDGSRLAACGTDNAAHVWNLDSGKIQRSLPVHPAWVQGCVFSPDGSQFATACRDGAVRVFDLTTSREVNRLLGHVGRVWSIAWEPAGTLLTAGADGTIRRWDPGRGFDASMLRELSLPGDEIVDVSAGPGRGRTPAESRSTAAGEVFAVDRQGGLGEIDLDQGRRRSVAVGDGAKSWHVAGDRNRRRLAVCDQGVAGVRVVSMGNSFGQVQHVALPPGVDPAEANACWTPAGDLVVRSRDGSLVWCSADLARSRRIGTVEGVVHVLAAAPAGPPRVALVGDRALIHPVTESAAAPLALGPPVVLPVPIETTAVAWSPDAAVLACGTRTGAVQFFDAATGTLLGGLSPHERPIVGLAFSPDGRIVLSADLHAVRISDAATLTSLDELQSGIDVRCIGLTADAARRRGGAGGGGGQSCFSEGSLATGSSDTRTGTHQKLASC